MPSVQIFALSDTIHFHVQLTGPLSSLRHFLPPPTLEPVASSTVSTKFNKKRNCIPPKPTIRVFLLRQITVEVRGQKAWRDRNLGEGKLWPLPPGASSVNSPHWDSQEASLDWEGEVRCRENITIGGFNAGKAVVKVSSFNLFIFIDVDLLIMFCFTHVGLHRTGIIASKSSNFALVATSIRSPNQIRYGCLGRFFSARKSILIR